MLTQEDQNQFEGLLAPVLPSAYGAALHMTRSREDAEDLVQEAALQAFRGFRGFEPGTHFKAWFFRILTNVFRQRYRKRQREPEIAPLADASELYLYVQASRAGLPVSGADPAELVLGRMDAETVTRAIAALPEEYRIVTALHLVDQFSYDEIAAILECPKGTVRSRLHRGRRMLQKSLWRLAEEQGLLDPLVTEGM
jgi:RNA polymerase sigma-70 factor (ECF subfamily)